jgi:hypothetical protein
MKKLTLLLLIISTLFATDSYKSKMIEEFSKYKKKYLILVNVKNLEVYDVIGQYKYYDSLYECIESSRFQEAIKHKSTQKVICASTINAIKIIGKKSSWIEN